MKQSICYYSVAQSCPALGILWTVAHQFCLSFIFSQSLLKLMSIKAVIASNHIILCYHLHFLPSIFHSIRVFSNELFPCIRWPPKYWSFSFSINLSNKYSGLISFRIDWLDLLGVQGSSPAPQFKNINSLVLSRLYGPTLTFVYYYQKNHDFDYTDLCWQNDVSSF